MNNQVKTLQELGYRLYSESYSARVYKQESETLIVSIYFDKKMKKVQINDTVWIPRDEDYYKIQYNIPENIRYSAKYGHWQTINHECTIEELQAMIKELEVLNYE